MLLVAQNAFGIVLGLTITNVVTDSPQEYGVYMWLNIAFMTSTVWAWQLACRGSKAWQLLFTGHLLAGAIVVGASFYWMFGLALMGLYLRPKDEWVYQKVAEKLDVATKIALYIAGLIVGYLLFHNSSWQNVGWGIALGLLAFVSQIIVTPLLTSKRSYTPQDRWYLAFGHQNGLTACILGLSTGTIAIVVPAIVVTHILHFVCNKVLDYRFVNTKKSTSSD